jgi:hypothetical protein
MEQVDGFLGKLDEGLMGLQAGESRMDALRQRLREQGSVIETVRVAASRLQS